MNKLFSVCIAAALAAPTLSFAAQPTWPAGAQKKDDPRVLTFYDAQCAQYADRNELTGDAREAFEANCQSSVAAVFPVGYTGGGDSGGGGDE